VTPAAQEATAIGHSHTDPAATDDHPWPPHPAQVFCALAAAADEDDRAALQWLEQQPPPQIRLEPWTADGARPGSPPLTFCWEQQVPRDVQDRLDALARRTLTTRGVRLRLGESLPARAARGEAVQPDTQFAFEPCSLLDADLSLGVPFPGFLDRIGPTPDDGLAWRSSRFAGFRVRRVPSPVRLAPRLSSQTRPSPPSTYSDVIIFTLVGRRRIPGWCAPQLAEALRSAILRAARDRAPEVLHGHRADGLPHVAFLALPDVGEPSSDGSIMGMAVAVPELPTAQRTLIMRAVQGIWRRNRTATVTLHVPGVKTAVLRHEPGHVRPWVASPKRWRQGSRRWTTATPVVLDHFPKRRSQTEQEIRESVRRAGLPEPLQVRFSTEPMLKGGIVLRPRDLPEQARQKLYYHVDLTFEQPVAGPVIVGAGRYLARVSWLS
jgi:CRISPR-associated protein Csb2